MEITNSDIAKSIDFINSYVLNYYNREIEQKPDPVHIQGELYRKHKIGHETFEAAMRIMHEEGCLKYITRKDGNGIEELMHTNKGTLLSFNGGMVTQLNRKKHESNLYKWGQWSILIAGIYYAIEILKSICHYIKH